jgi:hypothetical protein
MNSLDIPRKCVVLRGGEEFWMEASKADALSLAIQNNTAPKLIKFEEEVFNVADITGILTPAKMDERSKLKRGMWRCPEGYWHGRFAFQEKDNGGQCDCEETFGNQVLKSGSFEKWAEYARYRQQRKADEIDKTAAPLLEERVKIEKSIELGKQALNMTYEQMVIWKLQHVGKSLNLANIESQITKMEEKIKKIDESLTSLRIDKKIETTDFFSSIIECELTDPESMYPMTQQQVLDFKDFLEKQVW